MNQMDLYGGCFTSTSRSLVSLRSWLDTRFSSQDLIHLNSPVRSMHRKTFPGRRPVPVRLPPGRTWLRSAGAGHRGAAGFLRLMDVRRSASHGTPKPDAALAALAGPGCW